MIQVKQNVKGRFKKKNINEGVAKTKVELETIHSSKSINPLNLSFLEVTNFQKFFDM